MNNDEILSSQIKSLRKLMHAGQSGVQIYDQLVAIKAFIGKQDKFFADKAFLEVLDVLLDYDAIESGLLDSKSLSFVLNAFAENSDESAYILWGIIFAKLYGRRLNFNHPIVFADITFFLVASITNAAGSSAWLDFDFDSLDLNRMFKTLESVFTRIIKSGSTYSIYLDETARNKSARHIFKLVNKSSKKIKILFACQNLPIEPMLVGYLVSLIYEAVNGKVPDNVSYYFCQENVPDKSPDIINAYYETTFLSLKNSFATQNKTELKNIKTNLKSVKKSIFKKDKTELENSDFDLIIYNPFEFNDDELKHFDGKNILLETKLDDETLVKSGFAINEQIASFIDKDTDSLRRFVECSRREKKVERQEKVDSFDEIFVNRLNFSRAELKIKLASSKFLINREKMLQYAELLYLSGQYSKAFDLIKHHYRFDVDYSYRLLKYIQQNCKNQKINKNIENFVIDKALDKEGFGQALLDSIVDGVDDYFEKNPDSILKDKHWL